MKIIDIAGIAALAISVLVAVTADGQLSSTPSSTVSRPQAAVDASGNLYVPPDYSAAYQFLGTWAIASDHDQSSKELHVVYASPGAITSYRMNGRFPEGAVLVKEVFQTATREMTTGNVSHAESLKGWFVMVKDSSGLHAGNKLWGDGWGWSWFDAVDPSKTTSTDFKTDCQGCHIPARGSDWIYVDGYPSLKR
jgi:hypothetical protein